MHMKEHSVLLHSRNSELMYETRQYIRETQFVFDKKSATTEGFCKAILSEWMKRGEGGQKVTWVELLGTGECTARRRPQPQDSFDLALQELSVHSYCVHVHAISYRYVLCIMCSLIVRKCMHHCNFCELLATRTQFDIRNCIAALYFVLLKC